MNKIRINDIDIAYRVDGDGAATKPWLVFSHSLACDHSMWDPQIDDFARACNVLRYDIRGHGQSSAPAGEYTLEQLADDLNGLLDRLRISRCHFAGLSLGGMIGQMAALRYPLRFVTLTLADTTSRYPADMKRVWDERIALARSPTGMAAVAPGTLERWFTQEFRIRQPDAVARIGMVIRATPVSGYIGCIHAIARLNLTSRLQNIDCPTLVIVGEDDMGTPPAMSEELMQAIPSARLERIKGAAHLSNVEQPAAFNQCLRNFLGGAL
jgi:3-oxoadipate enol-lactonase